MGGGGGGSISNADLKQLEEKAKQALKTSSGTGCHVFISFAYEDENAVKLLRGQARNEKSELSFDDFSLRQAVNSENEEYIKQRIRKRIERASVTVVYLTADSAKSKWVDWEIAESLKRGKGVIGVYQGDAPPRELPAAFNTHGLKTVKWSHQELMNAIGEARKNR